MIAVNDLKTYLQYVYVCCVSVTCCRTAQKKVRPMSVSATHARLGAFGLRVLLVVLS